MAFVADDYKPGCNINPAYHYILILGRERDESRYLDCSPSLDALRRSFDLLFELHFSNDFCSFDFRPDFEVRYEENPFLVVAIIILYAQYLPPEEAHGDFGLGSRREVWCHYVPLARSLARTSSDEATGAPP